MSFHTQPSLLRRQKLAFMMFFAVSVHIAVILGIRFVFISPPPPQKHETMELTFAYKPQLASDNTAQFLAQEHQKGAGEKEELIIPTTQEFKTLYNQIFNDILTIPTRIPYIHSQQPHPRLIATKLKSIDKHTNYNVTRTSQQETPLTQQGTFELTLAPDITNVTFKQDVHQQDKASISNNDDANLPATKKVLAANYLNSWRKKVESIGNQLYLQKLQQNQWYGDVKIAVSLNHDGKLTRAEVIESSGNINLDTTALDIINISAPFDPFPENLRRHANQISFTRIWQFQKKQDSQ